MLPLYKRLSDDELLTRCVPGLTQNQNEAFNATVWKRCPKERRFGAGSVTRALGLAAIIWNSGVCYDKILQKLNMNSNMMTLARKTEKNLQRVSYAARRVKKAKNKV